MYSRIAILGLGLMGGSLWQLLTAHGHPVCAYDMDPATREEARRHAATTGNRLADRVADTIPAAVVGADLVVIAVSTLDVPKVLHGLSAAGYRGVLTDVTSIKEPLEELVQAKFAATRWVGGHPMVGFERAGYFQSDSRLYDDVPWALCLDRATRSSSALGDWLGVAELLTSMGCRVVPTTAHDHDTVLARTNDLPHLISSAFTRTAISGDSGRLALSLGGDYFADVSRAATTRTDRTAGFCANNARALRRELDVMIAELSEARRRLDARDPSKLQAWLEQPHRVREAWPAEPGAVEQFSASVEQLLDLGRAGGAVTAVHGSAVTAIRPAI